MSELSSYPDARTTRTELRECMIRAMIADAAAGFECIECDERSTSDELYRAYHSGEQLVCPGCAGQCLPVAR